MKAKKQLQFKTWFQEKVKGINNNLPIFLKIVIVANLCLLLASLVIFLVSVFCIEKQNNDNYIPIPEWFIFVMTFLGSIFNLVSIVLMCFKKKASFIWGLLAVICLGFAPLKQKLWGLVIIYWGYYVIAQIIMFYWWSKKINSDKKIITKHIKIWPLLLICLGLLALAISLTLVRWYIPVIQSWLAPEQNTLPICLFLDSFVMVFTLSVVYFVARRYIERWIISLIINTAQIILFSVLFINNILDSNWIVMVTNIVWLLTTMTLFSIAWYSWIAWNKKDDNK